MGQSSIFSYRLNSVHLHTESLKPKRLYEIQQTVELSQECTEKAQNDTERNLFQIGPSTSRITRKLDILRDFPGGPVVKILRSQCGGPRFDPWLGS